MIPKSQNRLKIDKNKILKTSSTKYNTLDYFFKYRIYHLIKPKKTSLTNQILFQLRTDIHFPTTYNTSTIKC